MEANIDTGGDENRGQEARTTPKDVYLHLLMIVTLIMSVVSFITLLFQYVNVIFPDPLDFIGPYDGIRWATAVLIVAFPVFMWLSYLVEKEIEKNPAKNQLSIRKSLIYVTLFVTAITIIVDLITLIFNFYGGDLTTRFVLKVVIVLITAGALFGYYRWELQRDDMSMKTPKLWGWVVSAIVVVIVAAGFFIAGSPAEQRNVRLDDERVRDLQEIQYIVADYWDQNDELPEALSDIEDMAHSDLLTDPVTEEQYEYNVTGDLSFELCANFATESSKPSPRSMFLRSPPGGPFVGNAENFEHEAERTCFERKIDPDGANLYPK